MSRGLGRARDVYDRNLKRSRSLDDLVFGDFDTENGQILFADRRSLRRLSRRAITSSRQSSLASTSETNMSMSSSFFHELDGWLPEMSDSGASDVSSEIFDKNFDWDANLNLSNSALVRPAPALDELFHPNIDLYLKCGLNSSTTDEESGLDSNDDKDDLNQQVTT